jgi:NAD(P)-dependent dehydrogenase (short-subunit alcohol dehydrogenase family)
MKRVAVVTGANRGLGLETSRQLAKKDYEVILTARDLSKAQKAATTLAKEGLEVRSFELDVTSPASIEKLYSYISKDLKRIDVLVNNAGILPDKGQSATMTAKIDTLREAMETNVYGPFQLIQKFLPMMLHQGYGRIVNVSSGMGQLIEMEGGSPGYRISKTALNAVTKIFSNETHGENVLINALCPGWVRTDMGGAGAPLSPEASVRGLRKVIAGLKASDSGSFLSHDGSPIPW